MFGIQQPVGICIVPKYQDPIYQNIPKEMWSEYRLKNAQLGRVDFDSFHEEKYEARKDVWIDREQHGQMGFHHEQRYKEGVRLGELPVFQNAPNKKRQRIIARQMFRNMTEQEIDEVVEIARMGISFEDLQTALTGKPVQRQVSAEGNEDGIGEEAEDGEGLHEDVGGQEPVSGVDIKGHTLEAEVSAGCEGMKGSVIDNGEDDDTFIPEDDNEESGSVPERDDIEGEVREPVDLDKLKADLGNYNPGSRKLRVRVVADEPVIAPGQ